MLEPQLSDRLAKLLRLACDNGATDGEKLAAIGRLSAIAAAHDLDWDRVLANGSGRDWTPTADTKAEAGEDAERISAILDAAGCAQLAGILTDWEEQFFESMHDRFKTYGSRMYISEKQFAALDRVETKMRRAGVL